MLSLCSPCCLVNVAASPCTSKPLSWRMPANKSLTSVKRDGMELLSVTLCNRGIVQTTKHKRVGYCSCGFHSWILGQSASYKESRRVRSQSPPRAPNNEKCLPTLSVKMLTFHDGLMRSISSSDLYFIELARKSVKLHVRSSRLDVS